MTGISEHDEQASAVAWARSQIHRLPPPKQLSEEEERDIHIQWLIDEVNELSDSEWDEVMSSRLYDKDGK